MGRNNTSLKKKKKGPKGKKARAKAKLERRWGEHVDEDAIEEAKIRIGKSRLVKQSAGKKKKKWKEEEEEEDIMMEEERAETDESFSSSSDNDSDDDDEDVGQQQQSSLNALLQNIQSKSKREKKVSKRKHEINEMPMEEDEYSDDVGDDISAGSADSSSSSDSETSSSEIDQEKNSIVIEDDDDDDDENNSSKSISNPYDLHFTKREALPDQKEEQTKLLFPFLTTKKVVAKHQQHSSMLDSSLELHLSQDSSLNSMLTEHLPLSKDEGSKSKNRTFVQWKELGQSLYQHHVRKVLQHYWALQNKRIVKYNVDGYEDDELNEGTKKETFSTLQGVILPSLMNYMDLYLPIETRKNRDAIDNLLSLHVLNHVLTSRSRVMRHDRRIKEKERQEQEQNKQNDNGKNTKEDKKNKSKNDDDDDEDKWRDQGYTRPKVLILLPTRGVAHSFLHRLLSLLGSSVNVQELDRFNIDYGPPPNEEDEDDIMAVRRRKAVQNQKGKDWLELFGDDVNTDDEFKIGISLTPNAVIGKNKNKKNGGGGQTGVAMKLYSEFYKSDIILASPLGLKMASTASKNDDDDDDEEATGDIDFLSSIEVCLLYKCQALLMQNWDHVNYVLDKINKHISKSSDIDFGRVRQYQLAGQSKHWRQLIMVSDFMDPFITSTFKRFGQSVAGRLKLRRKVSPDEASLCDVLVKVRQVFTRIPTSSFQNQCEDKLSYFQNKVLPQIQRLKQSRTIIYVPSYFDYISLRNLLMKVEASFVSVTEYSKVSEVSRGRARFNQGRKSMLLYTGRAHYFMRHVIKGARHIILFGLPENMLLYPDLVNMLMAAPDGGSRNDEDGLGVEEPLSCLALFTKYDALALERIVGTGHCERMVKGEKSTFLFCS